MPTVTDFLDELPADRRQALSRVRGVIRKHLPTGYEEVLSKGMIVFQVPFERYSDTYNGHPLWYVALAAQKNYLALHFMPVYRNTPLEEKLRAGFKAAGKKLDMGKACIRFKSADDLDLGTIGEIVGSIPVEKWVAVAESWRR